MDSRCIMKVLYTKIMRCSTKEIRKQQPVNIVTYQCSCSICVLGVWNAECVPYTPQSPLQLTVAKLADSVLAYRHRGEDESLTVQTDS